MSWRSKEMARFDPDGEDMRVGGFEEYRHCIHCDKLIEFGVECEKCKEADNEA